jgi:hypothetical protein
MNLSEEDDIIFCLPSLFILLLLCTFAVFLLRLLKFSSIPFLYNIYILGWFTWVVFLEIFVYLKVLSNMNSFTKNPGNRFMFAATVNIVNAIVEYSNQEQTTILLSSFHHLEYRI